MKYFILLFSFILSSLFAFSQSNVAILNIHLVDQAGNVVPNFPVVIIKPNITTKVLTGADGIARDTSPITSNLVVTYKISIEDKCTNKPFTTEVKILSGITNIDHIICSKIVVTPNPCKVSFESIKNNTGASSNNFTFITTPQDPKNKYFWNFGDNTTGEGMKVQHSYKDAGLYVVTVTMSTPDGCSSTFSMKIEVGQSVPPNTNPALTCTCCATMNVMPTNAKGVYSLVGKSGFDKADFSWTIDSVHLSGADTKIKLDKAGTYKIQMEAKSDMCDVIINKSFTIKSDSIAVGTNDCKIDFVAISGNTASGSILFKQLNFYPNQKASYLWQFGDGTSSSEMSPNHLYAKSGAYKVTLTMTFSAIKKCTITKEIIAKVNFTNNPGNNKTLTVANIYPNPASSNFVSLDIQSLETTQVNIAFFNQNNSLVKNVQSDINIGDNTILIPTENILPGLYYVVINSNGQTVGEQKVMIGK